MLKVEDRVSYLALNRVHDINRSTAPDYLNEFFIKLNTVHSHNTRRSHGFFIKSVNTHGKKTFSYNGALLWNNLPRFVTEMNKNVFKKKCKKLLFEKRNEENENIFV